MSGVKHTRGRWRTVGVHHGHPQYLRLFGPDGKRVCYLPQAYTDEAKRLNEANARLIAAAPELLEALERSAEGWDNAIEFNIIPPQHRDTATILRDEARAAIARARGES